VPGNSCRGRPAGKANRPRQIRRLFVYARRWHRAIAGPLWRPACALLADDAVTPTVRPPSALRIAATYASKAARASAGSGEVHGRSALMAAARRVARCGSFMACGPAGRRGEAWLKKGLLSSK
jgi:hypothetical protein